MEPKDRVKEELERLEVVAGNGLLDRRAFLRSGAAFAALSPAMTAVMAIPILGEWPTAMDWIAIAGISVGVYVVSGGPLPRSGG